MTHDIDIRHYRNALNAQDASNIDGVVHDFAEALTEMASIRLDNKARENHPVTILFVNKLTDWCDEDTQFSAALDAARRVVEKNQLTQARNKLMSQSYFSINEVIDHGEERLIRTTKKIWGGFENPEISSCTSDELEPIECAQYFARVLQEILRTWSIPREYVPFDLVILTSPDVEWYVFEINCSRRDSKGFFAFASIQRQIMYVYSFESGEVIDFNTQEFEELFN